MKNINSVLAPVNDLDEDELSGLGLLLFGIPQDVKKLTEQEFQELSMMLSGPQYIFQVNTWEMIFNAIDTAEVFLEEIEEGSPAVEEEVQEILALLSATESEITDRLNDRKSAKAIARYRSNLTYVEGLIVQLERIARQFDLPLGNCWRG